MYKGIIQCKHLLNRSRFDRIMATSLCPRFLAHFVQSRLVMSALSDWKLPAVDVSQHKQHLQTATVITVQITGMKMVH